ncbi:MAG: hypothetical protein ACMXYA_02360 [Candidatus Woesearchaeota archaeon]
MTNLYNTLDTYIVNKANILSFNKKATKSIKGKALLSLAQLLDGRAMFDSQKKTVVKTNKKIGSFQKRTESIENFLSYTANKIKNHSQKNEIISHMIDMLHLSQKKVKSYDNQLIKNAEDRLYDQKTNQLSTIVNEPRVECLNVSYTPKIYNFENQHKPLLLLPPSRPKLKGKVCVKSVPIDTQKIDTPPLLWNILYGTQRAIGFSRFTAATNTDNVYATSKRIVAAGIIGLGLMAYNTHKDNLEERIHFLNTNTQKMQTDSYDISQHKFYKKD